MAMRTWRSALLITILTAILATSGICQTALRGFVIDPTKPYVYLKFDHLGTRKPANDWESSKGLWLRLVNNCRIPLKVSVFDVGNQGVGINFDVSPVPGRVSSDERALQQRPFGYSVPIGTQVTIEPGKDLLFSIPAESVTPAWYIQVRFQFDLPTPKNDGYQPYSVVDFTWQRIPKESSKRRSLRQDPAESPATSLLHEALHVQAQGPQ